MLRRMIGQSSRRLAVGCGCIPRTAAAATTTSTLFLHSNINNTKTMSMAMTLRQQQRSFSMQPPPYRSSPQYNVYGESNMLSVKVIPPTFRALRNGTIVLDNNKKGRVLLEWTPKGANGGIQRDTQIRFGLSPEEVGFLLHQLPQEPVAFVRIVGATADGKAPLEKVLNITPGEGGQFSFAVDFERDGIGGQLMEGDSSTTTTPSEDVEGTSVVAEQKQPLGPQEVVVQLGEMQVIRALMEASIPTITGWTTQMDLLLQTTLHQNITSPKSNSGYYSGNFNKNKRPVMPETTAAAE